MKKVLLISHFPPPSGGIATWTKRVLALGLPDGWEIDHINSNMIKGRDMAHKERNFKNEWERSRNIWRKEKEFLKNDPDIKVVHTNIPCTAFGMIREIFTARIAKKHNKKFILHCHSTVPNVVNRKFKIIFWKILTRYCDGIITLNTRSYDFAKKHTKANVKIVIVPNFVEESTLPNANGKLINEHLQNVMYAGSVTSGKGCDVIIRAAKEFPNITFNLVGVVSEEIKAMDAPKNVVFHGLQDVSYVRDQMKKNDAFIFVSRYFGEGFSVALLEAMSEGLPCIVTDWAANADMIFDKGGIVMEGYEDESKLVEALKKLDDKELRAVASEFNIDKVKTRYTDKVILKEYTDFYTEVIS